jgi:hypothetical protein
LFLSREVNCYRFILLAAASFLRQSNQAQQAHPSNLPSTKSKPRLSLSVGALRKRQNNSNPRLSYLLFFLSIKQAFTASHQPFLS